MLYTTIAQVGFVALSVVTLLAMAIGNQLVRVSAALHLVNWVLVALLQRHHEHVFQTADFLVDLIGAGLACWVAVAARQLWAASIAACQVLGVINYPVQLLDRSIFDQASVTASYIWEAGALVALILGALQARVVGYRRKTGLRHGSESGII